jgi:predicted dehydrogenase
MAIEKVGVGIVGTGRMGRLRSNLVAQAPQSKFVALADRDPARVEMIAEEVGADFHATENEDVISHPDVDVVIVSTPEHSHADPVCRALELGKPVLVEKPLALTLADADRILAAKEKYNGVLYVGYTQRVRRRFLNAKEQLQLGRLGELVTARMSVYNPRHQAEQIIARSPHAGPVTDVLTYMVDMGLWYFEGRKPTKVYAQGTGEVFPDHPSTAGDGAWALLTLDDGSTISLGCSWLQPKNWPSGVCTIGIELIGTEGALVIDDSHKDSVLATQHAVPSPYAPDTSAEVVFLESMMAGDWLLGDFWGPMRDETRLFLEHVTTGKDIPLTKPEDARTTLEVTLAIELSTKENRPVDFPLPVA